jgi:hypothetical protein
MALSYLNFDLLIDRTSDRRYRANVTASPTGLGSNDFDLPFEEEALRGFVVDVVPGTVRGNVPATDAPELLPVKEFGEKLCASVFGGSVRDCFVTSLSEARRQRAGLRIRLRLGTDSGLVNLPWECMFDPVTREFLGLRKAMSIVRYVPLTSAPSALAVDPPLRILAVVSSPRGYPPIDADRELLNLRNSLKELIAAQQVVLDPLETPTLSALQERIDRVDYHVFHFIGHGEFDPDALRGVLVLEDGAGGPDPVSAESMGTILQQDSLRLVILNACEGGRASAQDPFAGTAQTLVRNDIPAVIAMQFMITDQAAIEFSRRFYGSLAANRPVDAAVSEARRRISTNVNAVEWATPVLYMRSDDGRIFDMQAREGLPPIVLDEPDDPMDLTDDLLVPKERPKQGPKPEPAVRTPPPRVEPKSERPAVSVAAALERVSSDPHGPQHFRLLLDNSGRENTEVHVSVEDREQALILDLSSETVVLPSGGETTADLVVRPRGRTWSTQPHEHRFEVVVEPTGDSPKVLRGVVVRPPTLTPARMIFAGLAVVAVLVLGFVLLRPHPSPDGGGGGGGGGGSGGNGEPWTVTDLPGQIAYVSSGKIRIFTPASGEDREIVGIPGTASDPDLSQDGKVLAFTVVANDGTSSIYTMRLPDGTPEQLTFPDPGESDSSPALSPDGNTIAFVRGPPHQHALTTMKVADRSDLTTLDTENDSQPAWSTNGAFIVFHRSTSADAGLYRIDVDTRTGLWLTHGPTDQSPTWAPGPGIVYHARAGDAYVLVLRQGGKVSQLVEGAEPAWSPDGAFIAFHQGNRVMVIDVTDGQGGEAKTILTTGADNPDPAW